MDIIVFLKSHEISPMVLGSLFVVTLMMLPVGIIPTLQFLCAAFGVWDIVDGINNSTIFSTWADLFLAVLTPYMVYRTIADVREMLETKFGI